MRRVRHCHKVCSLIGTVSALQTQESSETQREREVRVKSRREIIEDREREMERHRDAVEGLLLLGDSQFMCEAGTDCSP